LLVNLGREATRGDEALVVIKNLQRLRRPDCQAIGATLRVTFDTSLTCM
jgi:hypothetical protein